MAMNLALPQLSRMACIDLQKPFIAVGRVVVLAACM